MQLQKRFDYNVSPIAQDDLPSFSTKYGSMFKKPFENPTSSISPIGGRGQLNASFENRYKQDLQERTNYQSSAQSKNEGHREKASNTVGYRQRQDLNATVNDDRNYAQNMKLYKNQEKPRNTSDNTKEQLNSRFTRNKMENSYQTSSQKIGNQTMKSRNLQQNLNFFNIRVENLSKSSKGTFQEPLIKEVNEKQLYEKISRINHLNEEINNRLQRMLSKISTYE